MLPQATRFLCTPIPEQFFSYQTLPKRISSPSFPSPNRCRLPPCSLVLLYLHTPFPLFFCHSRSDQRHVIQRASPFGGRSAGTSLWHFWILQARRGQRGAYFAVGVCFPIQTINLAERSSSHLLNPKFYHESVKGDSSSGYVKLLFTCEPCDTPMRKE